MPENKVIASLKEKYDLSDHEVAKILEECDLSVSTGQQDRCKCVPGYNDDMDYHYEQYSAAN